MVEFVEREKVEEESTPDILANTVPEYVRRDGEKTRCSNRAKILKNNRRPKHFLVIRHKFIGKQIPFVYSS